MHTDHPVSQEKWLRMCAVLSMKYGLPEDAALKSITINPAEMAKVGMEGFQQFMVQPDQLDSILDRLEKARQRIYK